MVDEIFKKKVIKTKKIADKVENWAGTEYHYLGELRNDLGKLKADFKDIKSENKYYDIFSKKTLKKANAALRQIGKSEKKVYNHCKQLKEKIEKLYFTEGKDRLKNVEVAAESILKKGSRWAGSFKKQLKSIEIEIALLKKYRNDPSEANIEKKINNMIDELINDINKMIEWDGGLIAAVEKLKNFMIERVIKLF